MIIVSSSGRISNSSKSSNNSRSSNCRSAVAAVIETITTSRNCRIRSSSSSGNCDSSSFSICIFTLSLLKNSICDGGDTSKNTFKDFLASVPKLQITTV